MAQPQVSTITFSQCLDAIPKFDGQESVLPAFLDASEAFLTHYFSAENSAHFNNWILRSVLNKLDGPAKLLVCSRTDLTRWENIRALLLEQFSDKRSIDTLSHSLMTTVMRQNENSIEFGNRLHELRCKIISKINLTEAIGQAAKAIHIDIINKQALNVFLHQLPYQINSNVRLRDPDDLGQAISYANEEEDFLYASRNFYKRQHNSFPKPRPDTRRNFQNQQNYNFNNSYRQPNQNFNNYNQFNRNFQRPNFNNSGNHNYFNRRRPNFGNNPGNFQQNSNPVSRNTDRNDDVTMRTVTQRTSNQNQQNYFRTNPGQRQNYRVQELTNVDVRNEETNQGQSVNFIQAGPSNQRI